MSVNRAIIWITNEGLAEGSQYPCFLQEVLFRPLLRWVSDALMTSGARSVCVVRDTDAYDPYITGNLPPELSDITLLNRRMNGFWDDLERFCSDAGSGYVLALTAPALITAHALERMEHAHYETGSCITELLSDDEQPTGLFGFTGRKTQPILNSLRREGDIYKACRSLHADGHKVGEYFVSDGMGGAARISTAMDLHMVRRAMQTAVVERHMKAGVQVLDPTHTFIGADVVIGHDTTLLPGVMLYGETVVGTECEIGPNTVLQSCMIGDGAMINSSQLEGAQVGNNAIVGPYAYVRPGCVIGNNAKVGNFVELKDTTLGDASRIPHLSYVGDADVGEKVNIGCGATTVNYEGREPNKTHIDAGAVIGSNTNLVAPLSVGRGAYTAAGSTITEDVPPHTLAIARSKQTNRENWMNHQR